MTQAWFVECSESPIKRESSCCFLGVEAGEMRWVGIGDALGFARKADAEKFIVAFRLSEVERARPVDRMV